jgi:hypothetical protein
MIAKITLFLTFGLITVAATAADQEIDASDPTKIYTFAGGGLKYSDYTNGESMLELRATANWGIGDNDSALFELGYGSHDGNLFPGTDTAMTNIRIRYFHLGQMNYDVEKGYRGMAYQVDLQFAGELKGTDGQNVIAAGIMPAYALGGDWNLYLMANVVGAWDKSFSRFSGAGASIAPKIVFSPDWWPGSQFQLTPTYKYFYTGALKNSGSGNIEFNVGGEFTPTIMWDLIFEKNFDVDLKTYRRGVDTGLENDWSIFFNATTYF